MISRASRQSIYISISDDRKIVLSGKYNFHCLKNRTAVFIREGGKIEGYGIPPYYFMYGSNKWIITDSESFEKNDGASWLMLDSKGLSEWKNTK